MLHTVETPRLPGAALEEPVAGAPRARSYWQTVGYRLRHDIPTLCFGAVVLLIMLSALGAPLLAPNDPYQTRLVARLKPFGYQGHLLGTDELGRDMLSRLLYGGRVSLTMGLLPVLLATIIGGSLGLVAGYAGRHVNMAIMRTMDVFFAFPSILLAVAISGTMGGGVRNGLLALTLVFIPPLCRIAETATTQVSHLDFVEAARASGAGLRSIIWHHILGNVLGPVLVYASSLVSVSMLIASGLSFLGLGVEPPQPDWGLMLNTLRQAIYIAPALAALPGVLIFLTSICFNLLSDGLRAAMDVRL